MSKQSKGILSLLENEVSNQLFSYSNLPYFLGFLYLKLNPRGYLTIGGNIVSWDDQLGLQFYKNIKLFKKKITFNKLMRSFPPSGIYDTDCYVDDNSTRADRSNEPKYVYSRNKQLCSLITKIVEKYYKDNIPYYYILPYLFFNQDKELFGSAYNKRNMYQIYADLGIKYNPQNKALKFKNPHTSKSYDILTYQEMISFYRNNIISTQDWEIRSFKYYPSPPEFFPIEEPDPLLGFGNVKTVTSSGFTMTTTSTGSSSWITVS